jgi:hypothetical protein
MPVWEYKRDGPRGDGAGAGRVRSQGYAAAAVGRRWLSLEKLRQSRQFLVSGATGEDFYALEAAGSEMGTDPANRSLKALPTALPIGLSVLSLM